MSTIILLIISFIICWYVLGILGYILAFLLLQLKKGDEKFLPRDMAMVMNFGPLALLFALIAGIIVLIQTLKKK
jgi:branched-subunit amino acid transport protein